MGRRSGLRAMVRPCVEGWFWASPARMGLNKVGDLIDEDVLGFFRGVCLSSLYLGVYFQEARSRRC